MSGRIIFFIASLNFCVKVETLLSFIKYNRQTGGFYRRKGSIYWNPFKMRFVSYL
jgi:hypothetical protein